MTEYSVVGKRVSRVDALSKVTGRALYAADISLPNMLCGKVLWSNCPHAKIRRLDVSKAKALKGVAAVITAADVPGDSGGASDYDPMTSCLAKERVLFAGQPVAAVAAVDADTAEEALRLIEVDYEELPSVIDVLEAMKPDAPLVRQALGAQRPPSEENLPGNVFCHLENKHGDIEAGFREADIIMEDTYRTQTVHQGYLEPRAALASAGSDGRVTVWTDSQGIFKVRELVAAFLKMPLDHVDVVNVEVGGAFGGKEHQIFSPLCALLSLKTGRPVRIVTTREEVFKTGRPTPASVIKVKVGATKDGLLTAVAAEFIYDFGALHGMGGLPEVPMGFFTGLSPYRIANLKIDCYSVYTNKIPSGPYRAPAAAQAAFAVESQMDSLSRALGMDPLDFRLKNAAVAGDTMPNGRPLPGAGFREVLEEMKKYLAEKGKPEGKNRGRGIACGCWTPAAGPAGAIIHVNADGTVLLLLGSVDLTGSRTSLAQIAAEELSIPFENVSVVAGSTGVAPFSVPSVGSMITRSLATPVRQACQEIKEKMCRQAAPQLEAEPENVEYVNGRVQVKGMPQKYLSFADLAEQSLRLVGEGPLIGRGSAKGAGPAPVLAVHAADVEVDEETGKVKILSFVASQDTGLSVNPTMIEGQMQGAVAQGIGWSLNENYVFRQGVMQNANFLDYRMPTAADLPFVDTLLVEVGFEGSPFGLRAVGEPPMVPSLAAVANAVQSATGVRLKELPMTTEAVFWALDARRKS